MGQEIDQMAADEHISPLGKYLTSSQFPSGLQQH